MNTIQIVHALEQDSVTRKRFCGVFPRDKLPERIDKFPCGLIANTDPSSEIGSHWLAFFFTEEQNGQQNAVSGQFFDSFGQPPSYYSSSFEHFLDKHSSEWDFNKRKLQSSWSDVCGQYCIFYLSHRARGHSMNKIVQFFSKDTMSNDVKVSQFVKNNFKVMPKQANDNFNQSSKKMFWK